MFKEEYQCKNLQASFVEKRRTKYHKAIDISTKSSDTYYVIASFRGKVTYMYDQCYHISSEIETDEDKKCHCNDGSGYGGYGNCIEISGNANGKEYTALYSHLKQNCLFVSKDQWVEPGDIIAVVGSSGSSYGPHLDFSIKMENGNGEKVNCDPLLFDSYIYNNQLINYNFNMYMKIPKNLIKACGSPSDGCTNYYPLIEEKYKIIMRNLTQ